MRLKTLIADDEPLARERLRFLLSPRKEVEVIGECRNGREVISHLKADPVDLLFLDIQMPGKTAFDVIEEIGIHKMPSTIFVTAYNEYAVKAFEVEASDYLMKPIEAERLYAALARVQERTAHKEAFDAREQLLSVLTNLQSGSNPKRILVRDGSKDIFLNVKEIEWIEAADYYSCLHVGEREYLLRESIKLLETKLDPQMFIRVHRSAIVNVEYVRELHREGRTDGWVVLKGGTRVRMTRNGWQRLLSHSQI